MKINTLAWNRIRYSLYAPIYDIAEHLLGKARRQAVARLDPQPGERILLVGCGTGLDLVHFPAGVEVVAVDLTPAMVEKTRARAKALGLQVDARVMNAEQLDLETGQFDAVVLHLVLAIVPNPQACIREAARVLKPKGRISIFDKFLPAGERPSVMRRLANLFTNFAFSDINRQVEPLVAAAGLRILDDQPVLLGGMFRSLRVVKGEPQSSPG